LWRRWKVIVYHVQVFDVIQDEQPVGMHFQPAFDGIDCVLLILLTLTWQVQETREAGEVGIEDFRRVRFSPQNRMVVVLIEVGIF
jgi:hypothetical protein